MTLDKLDSKQLLQEEEYEYPYHYIPTWDDGRFSQAQYWSWGFRYLGGIEVVLDQLQRLAFDSLVDIGCGAGRFLREAVTRFPGARLLGVDYSERAIGLAEAMNPELDFRTINVIEEPLSDRFDVATCIEVLEHIPPDEVKHFCEAIANSIRKHGWLVLTVPHSNKHLNPKHYQHFNSNQLGGLLSPYFHDLSFVPFDRRSRFVMPLVQRLIGGAGSHFVLTNSRLNSWFYRLYKKRYLYARTEDECWRIAVVCQRR